MGAYEIFSVGICLLAYVCFAIYMILERDTVLGTLAVTGAFVLGLSVVYPLFLTVAPTVVAILLVMFIFGILA